MNPEPKSRGLLFNAQMIVALLNTKPDVWPAEAVDPKRPWKWQTRRVMKPQPTPSVIKGEWFWDPTASDHHLMKDDGSPVIPGFEKWQKAMAPNPIGSLIYAKETFSAEGSFGVQGRIVYRANIASGIHPSGLNWKPSIFMPRSAARIWLRVMNVRVERVNEISERDALAEGVKYSGEYRSWTHRELGLAYTPQRTAYAQLWDSINGTGDFDKGHWVWVYDLSRISKPCHNKP